jgi:hypothetical protein
VSKRTKSKVAKLFFALKEATEKNKVEQPLVTDLSQVCQECDQLKSNCDCEAREEERRQDLHTEGRWEAGLTW